MRIFAYLARAKEKYGVHGLQTGTLNFPLPVARSLVLEMASNPA
jgi:hypothetical protein